MTQMKALIKSQTMFINNFNLQSAFMAQYFIIYEIYVGFVIDIQALSEIIRGLLFTLYAQKTTFNNH